SFSDLKEYSTAAAYSDACSLVKVQKTFISNLSGRSAMRVLSVLRRRKRNGPVSRFNRLVASALRLAWMGTKKARLNSACVPRKPGFRDSIIDHNSPMWVSTSVTRTADE